MNVVPLIGTINFQKLLTLVEVARFLAHLKKNGEVLLPEHPLMKLNFVEGRLVHAKTQDAEGDDAAVSVLRLKDTPVSVTLGLKSTLSTVKADLETLIKKSEELPSNEASEKTVAVPTLVSTAVANSPATVAVETSEHHSIGPSAPVPDTLKSRHGSPQNLALPPGHGGAGVTFESSNDKVVTSVAETTASQQPGAAKDSSAAKKKPVLRITLHGVSKDFVIIPGKVMTIGRTTDNDICIPDGQISSKHATIELNARGMCLRDNNSLNGVHMGGKAVKEIWLKPNDQFYLGEIPVVVTLG